MKKRGPSVHTGGWCWEDRTERRLSWGRPCSWEVLLGLLPLGPSFVGSTSQQLDFIAILISSIFFQPYDQLNSSFFKKDKCPWEVDIM